jgi:peptidoglycan/xylan/chitin deacetylase (PgdA/CDA1 family)
MLGSRFMRIMVSGALATGICLLLQVAGATAEEPAVDRQMAITFDDLPAQRAHALPEERILAINEGLVEMLTDQAIPAIGFVNEEKLYVDGAPDPERVRLLELWLRAGLELGNHTFSHPDLHRVPLEEFKQDLLRGEQTTGALLASRDDALRYFRHPFLHTGLDLETKLAVEDFLAQRGYRVAPVTIDNSEWIFARAYDEALDRRDKELQARLAREYLDYMMGMVRYYEGQSRGLFDREIPQVLLLHANALNAHHLVELVVSLRQRGYRFIDLDKALEDPAYSSEDTYTGPGGITWLHRWAITRDVDRSLFQGEPTTASWVQEVAGIEE